jgi:hypothetical protein
LHRCVLLRNADYAGVALRLLQLAIDQVVIALVPERYVALVHLGDDAVAALVKCAFGVRDGALGIPGIGIDPSARVGDRHERLAKHVLARQALGA